MFKSLLLLSLFATVFAMPGYIHPSPVLTSYHAVPTVHVVHPIVATHKIITPVLHTHGIGYGYHGLL